MHKNIFGNFNFELTFNSTPVNNRFCDDISTIDFSSSTHVYNPYNCNIIKNESGSNILTYVTSGNIMAFVGVTD